MKLTGTIIFAQPWRLRESAADTTTPTGEGWRGIEYPVYYFMPPVTTGAPATATGINGFATVSLIMI